MLLEKIKFVKLVDGEEFVCGLVSDEGDFVVVSKPMTLQLVQQEDGSVGLGFRPWLMVVKNTEIKLPKSQILVMEEVDEKIASVYNIQYQGGIDILPKQLIV